MNTQKVLMLIRTWISFLMTILILAACAAGKVPTAPLTMAEVYQKAMQKTDGDSLDRIRHQLSSNDKTAIDYSFYTPTPDAQIASDKIHSLFPKLKNSEIVVYVYPHLATKNQVPIPGYFTVIPFYDHPHYLLPSDVY